MGKGGPGGRGGGMSQPVQVESRQELLEIVSG